MAQSIKRENAPFIKREEETPHQNHGVTPAALPTSLDARTIHQAFVKTEPSAQGQILNASPATSLGGGGATSPPIPPHIQQYPAALSTPVRPQNGNQAFIKIEPNSQRQMPNAPPAAAPGATPIVPGPSHTQHRPAPLSTPVGPQLDPQAFVKAEPSTQAQASNARPALSPGAVPSPVPPQIQQPRRQRQPKADPVALYIAHTESSSAKSTSTTDGADPDVLKRILGCLNRGNMTRNASESEAKTAVRMAHRLMMQHNIQESDMNEFSIAQQHSGPVGGASTVRIVRPEKYAGKRVRGAAWHSTLAHAVKVFFDCGYYTTQDADLSWFIYTFYGLPMNIEIAAESFKTTFNIMQERAVRRKGSGNTDYLMGFARELYRTAKRDRQAETDAAHGSQVSAAHIIAETPASGLNQNHQDPTDQQQSAVQTDAPVDGHNGSSIKHEEKSLDNDGDVQMGGEVDVKPTIKSEQNSQPQGASSVNDMKQPIKLEDDDDDCIIIATDYIERHEGSIVIDLTADSDEEIIRFANDGSDDASDDGDDDANNETSLNNVNVTATDNSLETADAINEGPIAEVEQPLPKWSSALQLQRYRDDAETAKTRWLESSGVKLHKGRPYQYTNRNREAYEQGRTDSKKYHLRHNRVQNEEAMDQSD